MKLNFDDEPEEQKEEENKDQIPNLSKITSVLRKEDKKQEEKKQEN